MIKILIRFFILASALVSSPVQSTFFPPSDPYYNNVVALMTMQGGNGSTTSFVDQKGHTFTRVGTPAIDTSQYYFYDSSARIGPGTSQYITSADNVDWEFGSGDFTIEAWVRFNSTSGSNNVISKISNVATDFGSFIMARSTTTMVAYSTSTGSSFDIINGVTFGTVTTGVWYHVAISRNGTSIRGYLNGVGTLLATTSAAIVNSTYPLNFGGANLGNSDCWLGPVRITKGVGRYPANFARPSLPFPNH